MHEINQHVAKQTVRPSKPRTRVAVHTILEVTLVHVSVRRTLLQPIDTLKDFLLILRIILLPWCNVRCVRSDDQRHGPNIARTYVRSSDTLSCLSLPFTHPFHRYLEEVGIVLAQNELARVHVQRIVLAHVSCGLTFDPLLPRYGSDSRDGMLASSMKYALPKPSTSYANTSPTSGCFSTPTINTLRQTHRNASQPNRSHLPACARR